MLANLITEEQIEDLEHHAKGLPCQKTSSQSRTEILEQCPEVLKIWRTYVGQAGTIEEQLLRIDRLANCYVDNDLALWVFGSDKFFYQSWLKYAEKTKDTEQLYNLILEKGIGRDHASMYMHIAKHFESQLRDLRRAD